MSENDQPLHIIHLASSERWTGAAEPAAMLAAEQLRQGHRVEFICIGGSSFERRLGELGIPFIPDFALDRRLRPGNLRADIKRLRALVASRRPDIIHCHLPHDHWMAALALRAPFSPASARRTAIIRTIHRDLPPRHDLAHRWLVGKGADLVVTVSQAQRQAMIEQVGLPGPKVKWVRGSVDLEKFRPGLSGDSIREIYHIPAEAHVAGMVARMQPHRGHTFLMETIEEVAAAVPQAFYALAGRGEIKNELVQRIREHPLKSHLCRIGYRKYDLPETYAAMDVIVLLVPGSDGSCRAMLEAMACGRPVIGSRLGAITDSIEPGVTGWLVEPGDRRDLARAVIEALNNLEHTRQMGEAARRYVEQNHTRAGQCRAMDEVYREALARRRTGAAPLKA